MKRSGKFYYKNEAEVMEQLGLKQVPGSGSGWVAKEDGESEDVLCQLKSTDANSIKVNKQDIDALILHAAVEHKLPVFAIQFLKTNDVYLVIRPEDLQDAVNFIETGIISTDNDSGLQIGPECLEEFDKASVPVIKSSSSAREEFEEERRSKHKRERSAL